MLVAFTFIASLQAKSQTSLYLANKSACAFNVEIVYCDGSTDNASCGLFAVNNFPLSGCLDYFKVYFGGNTSADIVIYTGTNFGSNGCNNPASQSGGNPCGQGYSAGSASTLQYNFAANQ